MFLLHLIVYTNLVEVMTYTMMLKFSSLLEIDYRDSPPEIQSGVDLKTCICKKFLLDHPLWSIILYKLGISYLWPICICLFYLYLFIYKAT